MSVVIFISIRLREDCRQNVVRTKTVAHEAIAECVTDVLTTFREVLCDLLLNRRTTTWNLFVLHNKETNYCGKSFMEAFLWDMFVQM